MGGEVGGKVRGRSEGSVRSQGLARAVPVPLDLERVAQAPALRFLDGVRDVSLLDPEAGVSGGAQPRWSGALDRTALSLTELVQFRPPLGVLVSALAPLPLACNAVAGYLHSQPTARGEARVPGAICCVQGLDVRFCDDGTPRLTVLRSPGCVHRKQVCDLGAGPRLRQGGGKPSEAASDPSRVRSYARGVPRTNAKTGILQEPGPEQPDSRAPPLHALFGDLLSSSAMASASPQLQSVADWWRDTCALICVPEAGPARGDTEEPSEGQLREGERSARRGKASAVRRFTTVGTRTYGVARATPGQQEPPSQRSRREPGGIPDSDHLRRSGKARETWPGARWAAECEARILACAEALPIDPEAYR